MSTISTQIGMTPIIEEGITHVTNEESQQEREELIEVNQKRDKKPIAEEDPDTDLELEEEKEEFDVTGRNLYLAVCKSLGVVPASYFLRHMQDSKLSLRHHGIGSLGAKAISYPLQEREELIEVNQKRDKKPIAEEDPDTDLELEEEKEEFDVTGRNLYLAVCKSLGVVPASYFLRHMQDSKLSLRHHGIGSLGAKAISYPLQNNTSVLELDLQDNWLEGEGGESVARMLKENCYISKLDISENRLGSKGAVAICNMLTLNATIKSINLSGNHFSDHDAYCFAEAFCENNRLKYVNLSHNEFSEKSGAILGQAIAENETIEVLDLSWNFFRRQSASKLCEGIAANCRLRELFLSMNGFGNEGAFAVAEIIKKNTTLHVMDISYNRISTPGAILIGKAMDQNDSLRILKMGFNPIGVEGAKALLTGVSCDNCVVSLFDISGVEVDKDFKEMKGKVIENKEITVKHGNVLSDYVIKVRPKKEKEKIFGLPVPELTTSNLLVTIKQYCLDHDINLGEVFTQLDKKKSGAVTIQDFFVGLQNVGIDLEDNQRAVVTSLLDDLAPENLINYGVFKNK